MIMEYAISITPTCNQSMHMKWETFEMKLSLLLRSVKVNKRVPDS